MPNFDEDNTTTEQNTWIIAIDPGRMKCGIAIVSGPDPVVCHYRTIVNADTLILSIKPLINEYPQLSKLIIGSGTGSATLRRAITSAFTELPTEVIDEYKSSERARQRYIEHIIPAGWRRLIPKSFRTPDRPYDDFVAWILAEDYFLKKMGNLSAGL